MSGFNRLLDLFMRVERCANPPMTVQDVRGYGLVNQWMDLDLDETARQADAMVEAGLNLVHFEALGYAERGGQDKIDEMFRALARRWDVFRRRGLHAEVVLANWNMGEGLPQNGRKSICHADYSDAWWHRVLDLVLALPDPERIWLCPISELACRNKGCRDKGRRWQNIAKRRWPHRIIYNGDGDSSPMAAPAGWLREYHCARSTDCPTGALAVSDHSGILNEFGGLRSHVKHYDAFGRWVRGCRARGSGVIYYQFASPDGRPDYGAIQEMGRVWRERA